MHSRNPEQRINPAILIGLFLGILSITITVTSAQAKSDLEKSICGYKEPFIFWLWNNAAGNPDASRISNIKRVTGVDYKTKDGRILKGYKLAAASAGNHGSVKGYLLVAQGNAMLADQIIDSFIGFSAMGYDVYVFDYRGYGRSEGKRRFKAILSDYKQIIGYLDSLSYAEHRYYGMSFGGVVLLDALKALAGKRRAVIDSTPSRLSNYGCPEEHDPVNNLPQDSSDLLFIAGLEDAVVKPESSRKLMAEAQSRGATVLHDPEFNHPFMDRVRSVHDRRIRSVMSFLTK